MDLKKKGKKFLLASLTQNACAVSRFNYMEGHRSKKFTGILRGKKFLRTSYRDNFDVHKT